MTLFGSQITCSLFLVLCLEVVYLSQLYLLLYHKIFLECGGIEVI